MNADASPPALRPTLIGDRSGSSTIEKIVLVAVTITVVASGARYLARGTNDSLKCQGDKVANPNGKCGEASSGAASAADHPSSTNGAPIVTASNDRRPPTSRDTATSTPCAGPACMCFPAGTMVLTSTGLQPIESIQSGAWVMSRDDAGGSMTWRPVQETFVNRSRALMRMTVTNEEGATEVVEVTPNHPFYVLNRGWMPARDLVAGEDLLTDFRDRSLRLVATETIAVHVPVYNLDVNGGHTYFVSRLGIWAHSLAAPKR